MTLLESIARMEGFYIAGTRANRNNNPGNIEYGNWAKQHGSTGLETVRFAGETPRFAVFPSAAAGFAAMSALLTERYKGLTVAQAIGKWAPGVENDTPHYIACVCKWTGLQPGDLVDPHLAVLQAA